MAETQSTTAQDPPQETIEGPDRTAALIGLCTLTTDRLSLTRTVGPGIQRAILASIYPYQGEVVTLEYLAGAAGCDYKTAQAAVTALEQRGYVVSRREQRGKACRYEISDEAMAESCEYHLTAKGGARVVQESRAQCESMWESIVGRPCRIPPEGRKPKGEPEADEGRRTAPESDADPGADQE